MLAELVPESRVRVEGLDQPCRDRVGDVPARRQLVLGMRVHGRLDRGEHLRRGGAARIGLDLEAVVRPRVVAGGDDDPRSRPELAREVAADLGRHRVGRREGADVVGGEDLDAGAGEVLGGEAAVMTDDDAAIRAPGLLEVLGHAACAATHVVEGVVLGDGGAPAVGAELDLGH